MKINQNLKENWRKLVVIMGICVGFAHVGFQFMQMSSLSHVLTGGLCLIISALLFLATLFLMRED